MHLCVKKGINHTNRVPFYHFMQCFGDYVPLHSFFFQPQQYGKCKNGSTPDGRSEQ